MAGAGWAGLAAGVASRGTGVACRSGADEERLIGSGTERTEDAGDTAPLIVSLVLAEDPTTIGAGCMAGTEITEAAAALRAAAAVTLEGGTVPNAPLSARASSVKAERREIARVGAGGGRLPLITTASRMVNVVPSDTTACVPKRPLPCVVAPDNAPTSVDDALPRNGAWPERRANGDEVATRLPDC